MRTRPLLVSSSAVNPPNRHFCCKQHYATVAQAEGHWVLYPGRCVYWTPGMKLITDTGNRGICNPYDTAITRAGHS